MIDINSHTFLYGVFGNPVTHSLGPVMHNSAFACVGYNGAYLAFGVKDIGNAVSAMKALNMKGASVTIPHKVTVMEFLDEVDEQATKIGAVNTIINKQGRLFGYNSDCVGAMKALSEKTKIKDMNVAILGAGGAARAIGFGIALEGGKLTIFNRSTKNGERLAKDLDAEFYPLSDFKKSQCQILINTTSVGMSPNVENIPIKAKYLEKHIIVMDIVYNPLKTRLLKEAENIGCVTIDGVAMFVYQAAFQFELWTGKKAPIDIMRNVVLNSLKTK